MDTQQISEMQYPRCDENVLQLAEQLLPRLNPERKYFYEKDSVFHTNKGVIEVTDSTFNFHPAKLEDYVTSYINVTYNPNYTWEDASVQRCIKWVQQAVGGVSEYFWKQCSDLIFQDKNIINIWLGGGSNTKSTLKQLLTLFILPEQNILIVEESDDNVTLDEILKDYGNQKIILICNRLPMHLAVKPTIKSQLKVIPFTGTWVSNPPKTELEQYAQNKFKLDSHFGHQLRDIAPAFLWILTQYLNKNEVTEPEPVCKLTTAYWNDNDICNLFTRDCISIINDITEKADQSASVTVNAVYDSFKYWFTEHFQGYPIPDKVQVCTELSKRWGEPYENTWYGTRIVS